jgi:hypothetical protein
MSDREVHEGREFLLKDFSLKEVGKLSREREKEAPVGT